MILHKKTIIRERCASGIARAFVAAFMLLPIAGHAAASCPESSLEQCKTAERALQEAELAVRAAASKKALWTTADDALKQAKAAFTRADYAAAAAAAAEATEQARLGIAQSTYPPFPALKQ